jgi:molecular chaperone Hsp33
MPPFSESDGLQRFLFEHAPIRGEIVHLDQVWQSILDRHEYPTVLRGLLGELAVAAVLLAATLKLRGSLVLQIQGTGALRLLVVECTGELEVRATAKWEGELGGGLAELVGDGRFVITLDPKDGKQAYQGIVALEGDSIAEILQNYMSRSEQLETHLWLACEGGNAAGMLLQKLPDQAEQDEDGWAHASHLADTLKREELLALPAAELLHRLYHEEDIRLFERQAIVFRCGCSRNNVAQMLKMIGREEVDAILAEQEKIEVHCEFCNERYVFDAVDAEAIFCEAVAAVVNETRH